MHSSFSLTSTNIRKSLKGTAFTYKHEAHPEQQENWGRPNIPRIVSPLKQAGCELAKCRKIAGY